jgi:KDO2-lipid IV(A) lauroyltransferase
MPNFKKLRRKMMWPLEALIVYSMLYSVKLLTFKGARRLGGLIGYLIYMVPSQKKLVLSNLKLAFPDKSEADLKTIAKKSTKGLVMVYIEFMWFYKSPARMKKYIVIPDNMKAKYAEINDPQPVILFGMHLGNWEFSGYGLSCSVIARRLKNPFIEKFINEGRESYGCDVIHEKGAVRRVVKALKQKKTVGMLVDQNTKTHQGGVFANFLGLPVTISKTPSSLARRVTSKVFICNCMRTEDGFEIHIKGLPKGVEEYADDEDLTQAMTDMMAEFVTEAPEQWAWLYKRWNYIPKNWEDRKEDFPYYAIMDKNLDFNG